MRKTMAFIIAIFIILIIAFSIIYSFCYCVIPATFIGCSIAILLVLLIGFVIELTLNDYETIKLRKEKMTKLENQYSKLLANTNKTQQDIDAFRIYCNPLTEI